MDTAVRYWAAYPGEVDAEIAAADAAEEAAEQAWLRELVPFHLCWLPCGHSHA